MSHTVSTDTWRNWIEDQRRLLRIAFQEIEQVQIEYQGAYTRQQAERDQALSGLADAVQSQAQPLDERIQDRIPLEREALTKRIASLDEELQELRYQADTKLLYVQQQASELRQLNPQLDEQEEALKAQLARLQAQLDDLNAQVSASSRGLGFLLHAGRIYGLDRERHRVLGQLQALGAELSRVRQQWQTRHESLARLQTDARAAWEALTIESGQVQQRRDYMAEHSETLAQRQAILFILNRLRDPQSIRNPALADQLAAVVRLNIQTEDLQKALGSIASILALLKGVDEGLNRFAESLRALISEQRRHSDYLPALHIELTDDVLAFGQTWDELAARSRDEQALADRPAEFVAAMQPFLDERLTEARIQGFFEALGRAIQQATARWR